MALTADIPQELLATPVSQLGLAAEPGLEQRLLRTSITRVQLLRLAMRGLHATEAAKVLGIHQATVRLHYNDPAFRQEVLKKVGAAFGSTDAAFIERTKSLTERLEEQATRSFDSLVAMLDPATNEGHKISDTLAVKVHLSFLDRVQETAQVSKSVISMDPVQLQHAAVAAREMDNVVPIRHRELA